MTSGGGLPTQRELADYTGLQPIYISKLVRALEDRGFVRRTADRADARAVRLELTHAGRSAARAAMAVVRALDSALTEPIGGPSSTQTRTLGELLSTLLSAPRPAPAP
jgi:DNA-binding MarR family transcriptional regulator